MTKAHITLLVFFKNPRNELMLMQPMNPRVRYCTHTSLGEMGPHASQ